MANVDEELDEIIRALEMGAVEFYSSKRFPSGKRLNPTEAKTALKALIEAEVIKAYKRGYVDGGLQSLPKAGEEDRAE